MNAPMELFSLAMQLPPADRANLAHQLLLSLEPETVDEDDVASAWQREIDGRLRQIADGNYVTYDWRTGGGRDSPGTAKGRARREAATS